MTIACDPGFRIEHSPLAGPIGAATQFRWPGGSAPALLGENLLRAELKTPADETASVPCVHMFARRHQRAQRVVSALGSKARQRSAIASPGREHYKWEIEPRSSPSPGRPQASLGGVAGVPGAPVAGFLAQDEAL